MSTIENYISKHKRESEHQVYVYISVTKYALKLH
jgi:hypothetical protein